MMLVILAPDGPPSLLAQMFHLFGPRQDPRFLRVLVFFRAGLLAFALSRHLWIEQVVNVSHIRHDTLQKHRRRKTMKKQCHPPEPAFV